MTVVMGLVQAIFGDVPLWVDPGNLPPVGALNRTSSLAWPEVAPVAEGGQKVPLSAGFQLVSSPDNGRRTGSIAAGFQYRKRVRIGVCGISAR